MSSPLNTSNSWVRWFHGGLSTAKRTLTSFGSTSFSSGGSMPMKKPELESPRWRSRRSRATSRAGAAST